MTEIRDFLERHLQAIFDGDVAHYQASTVPESWVLRVTTRNRAHSDAELG